MLYSIYAESTPNPEVMKFVSNRRLTRVAIEINSKLDAKENPIAQELFKFPFIKRVYINNNFISVFKKKNANWEDIAMQIRIFIADLLNNNDIEIKEENVDQVEIKKKDPQVDSKRKKEIESLLDEYIKPAVESDGGEISLKSLRGNIVTVNMRGACSGCPSASITLKNGIESLLKTKIDKNIEVVAEEL